MRHQIGLHADANCITFMRQQVDTDTTLPGIYEALPGAAAATGQPSIGLVEVLVRLEIFIAQVEKRRRKRRCEDDEYRLANRDDNGRHAAVPLMTNAATALAAREVMSEFVASDNPASHIMVGQAPL